MIRTDEVTYIGKMGRQGWRRIQEEIGEDEFFVLDIDGILVPWRTEQFTLTEVEKYAGCDAYTLNHNTDDDEDEDADLTWEDLIGYEVVGYGRIANVDETTMNILLVLEDGRLLPGHEDLIVSLDTEERKIVMDLPEGL